MGCGTRRTVAFGEARFTAGLDVGRKFGVPRPVNIDKSASYGSGWIRSRYVIHVSSLKGVYQISCFP